MAFFDNPKALLAHLRHSFITSDDTGMCELIMINEDLDKEIKSDHKFSKKSLRLVKRFNPTEKLPQYAAKSYDIQASPTLSRRPPLKNSNNTFELAEQRKRKKSGQMKTVVWQDSDVVVDPSLFPPQEVTKKPVETEPSLLSVLLAAYDKKSANPFFEYSKFNGENHSVAVTNTYHIFLPMTKTPTIPITISVLHSATVADLVGLTFWKYLETTKDPVALKAVHNYAVMISEEDGDVDMDLPPLERDDHIAKFRFRYLGIVELKRRVKVVEPQATQPKHIAVKVYYEEGGFSTLAVDNMTVDMGEILSRVIRKRRLLIHGYELGRCHSPGQPIDLNSTLESQGTLDFNLVKNIGRKNTVQSSVDDNSVDSPHVKAELTSHQYKSYHVVMIHKVRSNTEVLLGVSRDCIEVDPVGQSRSGRAFFSRNSQKPMSYEISKICTCEIIDEKNPQRTVFRVIRVGKDGNYKNMDFETTLMIAKEIVRKINLILEGLSGGAKLEWSEQARGRKGTKSLNL